MSAPSSKKTLTPDILAKVLEYCGDGHNFQENSKKILKTGSFLRKVLYCLVSRMHHVILAGTGGQPGEGPYIKLQLAIADNIVREVACDCNGCPTAFSVCEKLRVVLTGRELERLRLLEQSDLKVLIGPLPEGKGYYGDLAWRAFEDALRSDQCT